MKRYRILVEHLCSTGYKLHLLDEVYYCMPTARAELGRIAFNSCPGNIMGMFRTDLSDLVLTEHCKAIGVDFNTYLLSKKHSIALIEELIGWNGVGVYMPRKKDRYIKIYDFMAPGFKFGDVRYSIVYGIRKSFDFLEADEYNIDGEIYKCAEGFDAKPSSPYDSLFM